MIVVLKFFSKKSFFARGISKVPEPCAADHPMVLQKFAVKKSKLYLPAELSRALRCGNPRGSFAEPCAAAIPRGTEDRRARAKRGGGPEGTFSKI